MIFAKSDEKEKLEKEIKAILSILEEYDPGTEEYAIILDKLERLYELKKEESKIPINLDSLIVVCGNLLGIVLILNYERLNVITSKAVSLLIRKRV